MNLEKIAQTREENMKAIKEREELKKETREEIVDFDKQVQLTLEELRSEDPLETPFPTLD